VLFKSAISAAPQGSDDGRQRHKLSLTERFRLETYDNTAGLSAEARAGADYTRTRSCAQILYYPGKKWEGAVKLTNEFRHYFVPETTPFCLDELIVDQLYIKWKQIGRTGLGITLGRQNMTFGEGFVIMDGGPLDGSRSSYFNAVRADYALTPSHSLSCFYAYQPEKDNLLPIIHDMHKAMVDQPEAMMGIYFTGSSDSVNNVQGYVIRKDNRRTSVLPAAHIHAIGGRIQSRVTGRFTLTAEGAGQFGTSGESSLAAFGGYMYGEYRTEMPRCWPQTLTIGAIYLSGDNPSTSKIEGWNPLYGRWPKWSDSYIYLLRKESGIAYWTNLSAVYGRLGFQISPTVKAGLDYYHLMAPKAPPLSAGLYGWSHTRGDLVIGKVSYQITKVVSGHVLWEFFDPSNYYFAGADTYDWFRMEFMLSY
jgi:hypothetical protein